jgi:hypothetical protein
MVICAIWAVDLDNTAIHDVILEIAVYCYESPLVGVGARSHSAVFRAGPN